MNRAERRRRNNAKATSGQAPSGQWRTLLDLSPMANGMTVSFLLYLLNEKEGFDRHGKLLTASLWLQSQMVGLICLHDDPQLRALYKVDNGRHFPFRLHEAAIKRLETLSSGSLRKEFLERFGEELTTELEDDLEWALVDRDALAHGYVSLFRQLSGKPQIMWSPNDQRSPTLSEKSSCRRPPAHAQTARTLVSVWKPSISKTDSDAYAD